MWISKFCEAFSGRNQPPQSRFQQKAQDCFTMPGQATVSCLTSSAALEKIQAVKSSETLSRDHQQAMRITWRDEILSQIQQSNKKLDATHLASQTFQPGVSFSPAAFLGIQALACVAASPPPSGSRFKEALRSSLFISPSPSSPFTSPSSGAVMAREARSAEVEDRALLTFPSAPRSMSLAASKSARTSARFVGLFTKPWHFPEGETAAETSARTHRG